jgi:hypothetical protein
VLLAQVRVQRCRSLLRPAPNKEQTINQNHIIIDYKSASYCLHRSMISDINVLYIYRPIGSQALVDGVQVHEHEVHLLQRLRHCSCTGKLPSTSTKVVSVRLVRGSEQVLGWFHIIAIGRYL